MLSFSAREAEGDQVSDELTLSTCLLFFACSPEKSAELANHVFIYVTVLLLYSVETSAEFSWH